MYYRLKSSDTYNARTMTSIVNYVYRIPHLTLDTKLKLKLTDHHDEMVRSL